MHVPLLLQMVHEAIPDRVVIGSRDGGMTVAGLVTAASRVRAYFGSHPAQRIALVDQNSPIVPITFFGAALAGKPYVPINYRLTDAQLRALVERTAPAILVGDGVAERIGPVDGVDMLSRAQLRAIADDPSGQSATAAAVDPEDVAVLLYTSGTTGDPKAAVLRHRHLASYILSTVELAGASDLEASIISVPPYHIAGVASALSSTYSGRRVVYLESFEPAEWVKLVRSERVTHAMVVPTMLNRILDAVEADAGGLGSLQALSYGGGPMPPAVIERAVGLLPTIDFVNAYGLTETSSTIAVMGADDHREAFASSDPAVRARLGSVGRPSPAVEVSIRDVDGSEVAVGDTGEIWVRGEQVSGEYAGRSLELVDGWFRTRDAGHCDSYGFLYVHGRLDDVIVRGGENLSPGEIEAVLMEHAAVAAAAVVGVPDTEWGEKVVAAVVPEPGHTADEDELRVFVRERLRSTRTPERIAVLPELPYNETGKLLRRALRADLAERFTS
jgi:acyl-CoA synthetase (AMP-forming)/AMP-acid ligase II